MKTKSSSDAPETTPQTPPEKIIPDIDIPHSLKMLEGKTPAQVIEAIGIPVNAIEPVMGLMSGIVPIMGAQLPKFAICASKQLWKNYIGKDYNLTDSIEGVGLFSKIIELILEDSEFISKNENGQKISIYIKPIADVLAMMAQSLSDEERVKFYTGRVRAIKVIEKFKNPDYLKMIRRVPIYFVLAIAWKQFEQFKSMAEAERWLRANKIIVERVESGEVRSVFRLVGLRYRGQGRPKKIKTDAPQSA